MGGEPQHRGRLTLVHPDGTEARYLTEGSAKDDRFSIFKISPDGRSIAYVEITTGEQVRHAEALRRGHRGAESAEDPHPLRTGYDGLPPLVARRHRGWR